VEVAGGSDGGGVVGVEVTGGGVAVGFEVSADLLDSAGFGVWLFVDGDVVSAGSSISGVEVAVSADSVDVVGSSVDSSGSVVTTDSPAEKEDEGAGDSSLPGCVAFCEQPTVKTLITATINNMLAFLTFNRPFLRSIILRI